MDLSLATTTLLRAPVLAFLLGALAVAIRSDLAMPEPVMTVLSYYLLLGIGIKGGVALRASDPAELLLPLALGLALGALIPVAAFWLLRLITPYDPIDRGAMAAHYGSTSLVTFTATIVALEALAIAVPGYAATLLTALEIPGIIVGLLLARSGARGLSGWGTTLRELLTGSSIVLLAGGLGIGAVLGGDGYAPIAPLFTDGFRGVLVLFLIGLGVQAARRVGALRTGGAGLLGFAALFPLAVVSGVTALGALVGLGIGGAVVLGVLCASASYIAAPAAVRVALPEANLALPLTASLSVTFPINLFAGIPLSIVIATALA
jgi:hypothetical protein